MGDALLSWVQAVGAEGVDKLADLADGVALLDIAARIAPQLFDDSGCNRATDGNWLLNATNIKILMGQMSNIYTTVLKKDPSTHIKKIDANAIARDKELSSIERLVELVLGAAVQCESKDDFIRVIMGMPQSTQQVLMGLIQKQMSTFPAVQSSTASAPVTKDSPTVAEDRSAFTDGIKDELEALQSRYDELSASYSDSCEETERLRTLSKQLEQAVEDSKSENQECRSQLRDAEAQGEELKFELESAQQTLESREDQMKQMRRQMEQQNRENENQALLDELDILRDKLVNAQKNEVLLNKAKKKLEDLSDLPNQVKSLEEQNALLLKEANSAAGSSSKVDSYKADLERSQSQMIELENQIEELNEQVAAGKKELQTAREIQNGLLGENQQLKTNNLELQQEIALKEDLDDSPSGLGGALGMLSPESTAALAESQAQVAQLQQENEALKLSLGDLEETLSNQKLDQHNNQDAAIKLNEAASQQADSQREIVRLTEQLGISEQEITRLKEAYTKAVQVCQSLKTRLSAKQASGAGEERADQLQQEVNTTEQKLHEAQERACEAERALQGKASEMRALEDDLKCVHEETEGLKERLREIVSQNEMLNRRLEHNEHSQMVQSDENSELATHKMTIQSLQSQLAEQEKNLANTKQQLDESTKLKDNEIKLVSTAFYEVGLELQKRWKAPQVGKTWLSKRRQMINQERRPTGI